MSRPATPGTRYWALIDTSGHPSGSPWVTVLGRHWSVTVDPAVTHTAGCVYTTRDLAAARAEALAEKSAGKLLEIAHVDHPGGPDFKRHVSDPNGAADERIGSVTTDPRRNDAAKPGRQNVVGHSTRR